MPAREAGADSNMPSNIEIVRRGFEHFATTGQLLPEIVAPDFVWDMSRFGGWPEQQTYQGIDGTHAFLRDWTEAWEDWKLELESLEETGDRVLAVLRQQGRSRASGAILEMTFAQVFTMREGLQTRMEMYSDVEEARREVGLT